MRFDVTDGSDLSNVDLDLSISNEGVVDDAFGISQPGHNGWFFSSNALMLLHNKTDNALALVDAWHQELIERENYFAQNNIRYFHICIPDKVTIHAKDIDRNSTQYSAEDQYSPLKILSLLKPKQTCLLDPTDYLTRQVGNYALYWKSDMRWTPWSAYMTCQMLCSSLKVEINNQLLGYPFDESSNLMNLDEADLPANTELIREYRFWLRSKRRFANDLSTLRETLSGQSGNVLSQAEYGEGAHVVFENRHVNAVNGSIVIFGDENSTDSRTLLTGMLAETYSEVHFVWSAGIDYEYVERVQPDIVITQGTELQLLSKPVTSVNMQELAERSSLKIHQLTSTLAQNDQKYDTPVGPTSPLEVDKACGNVQSKILLAVEQYELAPPLMSQAHEVVEHAESRMLTNEVVLHEVSGAQVFFNGPSYWVHDNAGVEVLRYNIPLKQRRAMPWRRGKLLNGTSLLFATSAGAHCYYHWMLEILPKLGMIERDGISLDSIDHFLVREITSEWQLETLARFGIDRSRIVETLKHPQWRCDKLLHIDLNCGINLKMPRFIPLWMKHMYTSTVTDKPRIKLYITRPAGVRRGITNEHEFLPLLKNAGFTIMAMEGLTVAEQAALLARVDVLMSPHGGALTNMVFCKPGITVIELLSRHVFPYYYGLAANCGHHYHAILENPEQDYLRLVSAKAAQSFANSQHETADLSFDVNVMAVRAVLEKL